MIDGQPSGRLESMAFLIHFLGKNGKRCVLDGEKWISGGGMNKLISHKDKKKNLCMMEVMMETCLELMTVMNVIFTIKRMYLVGRV